MNTKLKRTVGLLMTTVLIASSFLPTACNARETKDIEKIEDLSGQFIEAFASGDEDELREVVEDDYSYDIPNSSYSNVIFKIASKTEISEIEKVTVDYDKNTAKAKLNLSVVDINGFYFDHTEDLFSEDELLEAIGNCKKTKDVKFTLNFVFDKDEDQWIVKKASAEKYMQLFDDAYLLSFGSMSANEAMEIFLGLFEGFAAGNFTQQYYTLDLFDMRVFESSDSEDQIITDAVTEFTKAYFKYIVDHGINIEKEDDDLYYTVTLYGMAPSKEEILKYFSSDERVIEMYMTIIRESAVSGYMTSDELWNQRYADIYYDMAKIIPNMQGEDFKLVLHIDPASQNPVVMVDGKFLSITDDEINKACAISFEQDARCYRKAVENLYYAGELTKEQYDAYIADLDGKSSSGSIDRPSSTDGEFVRDVEWGHIKEYKNWAEDVHEFIPEDYTGNLIFGISEPDPYKTYMIYGKNPEYIDTFGYCYFNKDFIFMIKLPKPLNAGDRMYYTTVENGIENNNIRTIVYQEEYDGEFVIRFPDLKFADNGSYEFRLWADKDATVLMGYVEVIQT